MAKHNELGTLGEDIACDFLIRKGLVIVERNYRKPYGEIDIVARETSPWWVAAEGKYRFVEVKSVSHETAIDDVSYETSHHGQNTYRPEENIDQRKVKRLMRVIQSYISSKNIDNWQFDVVAIFIDSRTKRAKVRHLEDIILGVD